MPPHLQRRTDRRRVSGRHVVPARHSRECRADHPGAPDRWARSSKSSASRAIRSRDRFRPLMTRFPGAVAAVALPSGNGRWRFPGSHIETQPDRVERPIGARRRIRRLLSRHHDCRRVQDRRPGAAEPQSPDRGTWLWENGQLDTALDRRARDLSGDVRRRWPPTYRDAGAQRVPGLALRE